MRAALLFGAAAALVGCAAHPVFEGGRAWEDGWRTGKVERVAPAAELGYRQTYDCRYREGGLGRKAPGRFAVVGVRTAGGHRHHVVPVVEGMEPSAGEEVLTNHRGCEPITRAAR